MMVDGALIFHSPRPVGQAAVASGSSVRPKRMLDAFRDIGVHVVVVDGNSTERAKKWRAVWHTGKTIAGIYSELSTMPIALTDADHIPRRPLSDFAYFQKLRERGVPVGVFYRDVYWRFPDYANTVPACKRWLAHAFYRLEAWQISRYVDHVFLPSMRMQAHIPFIREMHRVSALPPGGVEHDVSERASKGPLRLFYVGGLVGSQYDLTPMIRAVESLEDVKLTICCRTDEWATAQSRFGRLRNVEVVHDSGPALEAHYRRADAFAMWRTMSPYLEFAMPVKLGEAIGWGLPVISNASCEAGDFVTRNGFGWTPHTADDLMALLVRLRDHRDDIVAVQSRVLSGRSMHSWRSRASEVLSMFSQIRGTNVPI